MKKLISGSFIAVLVLISSVAQATIVEISANPSNATPGIKAFVKGVAVPPAKFITPFFNEPSAPVPQSSFSMSDKIRVATQLDLTQIVLGTDKNDPASDLFGGHFGNGFLDWTYTFEALFDSALSFTGHVGYGWTNVSNAQTDGLLQVNFISNDAFIDSGILANGLWKVTSYVEDDFMSETTFSVPEPTSLALLGLGLLAFGRRRVKNSKI